MSDCDDSEALDPTPASGSGQCGPEETDLGCQKGGDPCKEYPLTATPWCDDRLLALPKVTKVALIGSDGCQLMKLDAADPGLVLFDGTSFYVSKRPCLSPEQLVNYLDSDGAPVVVDGVPVEQDPPGVGFVAVIDDKGCLWKMRGKPGSAGLLQWDGTQFVVGNLSVNRIEVDPEDKVSTLRLIGISNAVKEGDLLACGEEAEQQVEDVRVLDPGKEGLLKIELDGTVSVVGICELYTEPDEQPQYFPFVPTCASGAPIQFKGSIEKAGVLYWNKQQQQFGILEPNEECPCDCGCAEYLSVIYDCETKMFRLDEAPIHVLEWQDSDNNGISVRLTITLPWPAMVTVYALRRLIAEQYSVDVVTADIYVNGCRVTSSDDGGMVASLTQASTNVGVAIVSLSKGTHTIEVGNQQTTSVNPINWSGSWLKAVAHKIVECDPVLRKPVEGDYRQAYTNGTAPSECDCPPGPTGAQGIQGPQGVQGIQGESGGGGTPPPPPSEDPPNVVLIPPPPPDDPWLPVLDIWDPNGEVYVPTTFPPYDGAEPTAADGFQYYAIGVNSAGEYQLKNISDSIVISGSP